MRDKKIDPTEEIARITYELIEAGNRAVAEMQKISAAHREECHDGGIIPEVLEPEGEIISLYDGDRVIPNDISKQIISDGNIILVPLSLSREEKESLTKHFEKDALDIEE